MARILIKYSFIFVCFSTFVISGCGRSFIIIKGPFEENASAGINAEPRRNFYYDRNIGDSLELKYSFEVKGSFEATTPAAAGNFLFTPDLAGRIYAFDLNTGKKAGHLSEKGSVYSSPLMSNPYLVFSVVKPGGEYSEIYIYDLSRGKELREIEVEGALKTEPVKVDDGFIFISEHGKMYKYNYNGYQVWSYEHGEFIISSPALWNDLVIFGDFKGNAAAVKASDGALLYKVKTGSSFLGGFAVENGRAFAGDSKGMLYCFNAESGKLLWSFDAEYSIEAFPAAAGESVIIGNLRGDLYNIDAETGGLIWKASTGGIINAAPAVFNNYIVQPDLNKKVFFIERKTGEIHKIIDFETRVRLTPLFYNGYLILGIDNGKVLVYEVL